ncbi:transposase [Pseudomonas sp. Bout1]|uniref:REP-associated tyrosine transposase n=1 Tax=Pseudomonas sp. Bout1 TaxID=3048600 RepID=UPI002AB5BCB2|nr:transposase [Pseudomonas sp. Bout1]MDY7533120.1 transposase [Pseudomonas sp. Bout1]MEB0184399.1 transposase [Pseudomonas sp. Bout1]
MPVSNKSGRLRIGRASEVGGVYLLTAVVDRRLPIFSDWRLGRLLVKEFRQAHEDQWANSLAFVVMPDHLHWLVQLRDKSLAELMCRIKSRSSLTVNRALGRRGRLWQKGYHDRGVRREEDLKDFARYVVCNPIRAGLVRRVHDYPLWDVWWL